MAMTATERSRVLRERRAAGKVVLTVVLGEDECAEIAQVGYAGAASTDRKSREAAVSFDAEGGDQHQVVANMQPIDLDDQQVEFG
jgi:hypothetical protein